MTFADLHLTMYGLFYFSNLVVSVICMQQLVNVLFIFCCFHCHYLQHINYIVTFTFVLCHLVSCWVIFTFNLIQQNMFSVSSFSGSWIACLQTCQMPEDCELDIMILHIYLQMISKMCIYITDVGVMLICDLVDFYMSQDIFIR